MLWSQRTLDAVFEKANGECYYCGKQLVREHHDGGSGCPAREGAWSVDYWIPRELCLSAEEHAAITNLVAACGVCASEKGDLTGDEFLARQAMRAGVPRSDHIRNAVFDKTAGHCVYCAETLEWDHWGRCVERNPPAGSWDVDRWNPPERCGKGCSADSLANLVPACCTCLREKGSRSGEEYVALRRRRAGLR